MPGSMPSGTDTKMNVYIWVPRWSLGCDVVVMVTVCGCRQWHLLGQLEAGRGVIRAAFWESEHWYYWLYLELGHLFWSTKYKHSCLYYWEEKSQWKERTRKVIRSLKMVLIRVHIEPLIWLWTDAKEKENDEIPPIAKYLPSRSIHASFTQS